MGKRISRKDAERWLERIDKLGEKEMPLKKKRRLLALDFSDWTEDDLRDCAMGILGR